jgi:putative isomerase
LKPWREKGECHENFLSTTGEGSSDPHYTWGALMVLIAVEELIDANPWHGLRFGNLEPVQEASMKRYPVQDSLYDVHLSSEGIEVQRDGKMLFHTDVPVEIRHVQVHNGAVACEVRSKGSGQIRIGTGGKQAFAAGATKLSGRV